MTEILRNIARRRLRTSLTVLGIVIGVFALTVLGSMAEKFSLLADGAGTLFRGRIVVVDKSAPNGAFTSFQPVNATLATTVAAVPGVAAAYPALEILLDPNVAFALDFPQVLSGVDPTNGRWDSLKLSLAVGRPIAPGEMDTAVIGADVAEQKDLRVGSTFTARDRTFTVVGILDRVLSVTDKYVFVPLPTLQAIYLASLPTALQAKVDELATRIEAIPADPRSADLLALRISAAVPELRAIPPSIILGQLSQVGALFSLVTLGAALIAILVGGLSVANTMVMAVTERVREIGIKKAVGATTGAILREYIMESAILGLLGGLIGVAAGAAFVSVVNSLTAGQGTTIFALTPRLAIGAVLASGLLGVVAGLYPAIRAARLDPVRALRSAG